jgi:hypothetical protein
MAWFFLEEVGQLAWVVRQVSASRNSDQKLAGILDVQQATNVRWTSGPEQFALSDRPDDTRFSFRRGTRKTACGLASRNMHGVALVHIILLDGFISQELDLGLFIFLLGVGYAGTCLLAVNNCTLKKSHTLARSSG